MMRNKENLASAKRWPRMAECPCSHGRREGTLQAPAVALVALMLPESI